MILPGHDWSVRTILFFRSKNNNHNTVADRVSKARGGGEKKLNWRLSCVIKLVKLVEQLNHCNRLKTEENVKKKKNINYHNRSNRLSVLHTVRDLYSTGRTIEDPDGYGRDRIQDLFAVRRQERRHVRQGRAGSRTRRTLVHSAWAQQGLLRNDRIPQEHGVAAHDEPGSALVYYPPGNRAARVASRGGVAARTGPERPRQSGDDLLGEHR